MFLADKGLKLLWAFGCHELAAVMNFQLLHELSAVMSFQPSCAFNWYLLLSVGFLTFSTFMIFKSQLVVRCHDHPAVMHFGLSWAPRRCGIKNLDDGTSWQLPLVGLTPGEQTAPPPVWWIEGSGGGGRGGSSQGHQSHLGYPLMQRWHLENRSPHSSTHQPIKKWALIWLKAHISIYSPPSWRMLPTS